MRFFQDHHIVQVNKEKLTSLKGKTRERIEEFLSEQYQKSIIFLVIDSHMDIRTIPDNPTDEAIFFGFGEKSNEMADFLISKNTITPIVIAIHGEWGSGKSSLLLTTKKKVDEKILQNNLKMKTVYFDAWQYEGSNQAAALVYNMAKPIEGLGPSTANNIGRLAIDVLSRNVVNMSYKELKEHFTSGITATEILSEKIKTLLDQSLPGGRLIVMIDDLDRCTIENTLDILNSIKLFLYLEKCIFVIAVDMKKIELAWKARYGKDEELLKEGTSYLEKIFQIKTNVPAKSTSQMKEYLVELMPAHQDLAELMAKAGPRNLRQIKRLLNIASFYSTSGKSKARKYELSVIWVLFDYLMKKNENAVTIFRETSKKPDHSFLNWISEFVPIETFEKFNEYARISDAINLAGGLPSQNEELLFEFFKVTQWILHGWNDQYDNIDRSLEEIVMASEESKE